MVAIIDLACEDKKALDLSTLLGKPIMKVDPIEDTTSDIFAASIRPTYHVVNQALFDVMDSSAFSFSRVAVVYDGEFLFVTTNSVVQCEVFVAKTPTCPLSTTKKCCQLPPFYSSRRRRITKHRVTAAVTDSLLIPGRGLGQSLTT